MVRRPARRPALFGGVGCGHGNGATGAAPLGNADAADLYEYASDPDDSPVAGWPVNRNVEESLEVIRDVLSRPKAYAVFLKDTGRAIGAVGLHLRGRTGTPDRDDECELGYWLGKPYWGRDIASEAVREVLRYAFENLGMRCVWAGYYDGNDRSRRVQEKCGFRFQWTTDEVDVPLMSKVRKGHVSRLTREEWLSGLSAVGANGQ